jgi:hypothetical protein
MTTTFTIPMVKTNKNPVIAAVVLQTDVVTQQMALGADVQVGM